MHIYYIYTQGDSEKSTWKQKNLLFQEYFSLTTL